MLLFVVGGQPLLEPTTDGPPSVHPRRGLYSTEDGSAWADHALPVSGDEKVLAYR